MMESKGEILKNKRRIMKKSTKTAGVIIVNGHISKKRVNSKSALKIQKKKTHICDNDFNDQK
jgi:hypothetical protein